MRSKTIWKTPILVPQPECQPEISDGYMNSGINERIISKTMNAGLTLCSHGQYYSALHYFLIRCKAQLLAIKSENQHMCNVPWRCIRHIRFMQRVHMYAWIGGVHMYAWIQAPKDTKSERTKLSSWQQLINLVFKGLQISNLGLVLVY